MALGCFVLIVIVAIFGIEGTLAVMRQRNVYVTLEVQSPGVAATGTPFATPTPVPGATPDPKLAVILVAPDQTLLIHAKWDYRIGPRFPDTLVHEIGRA